MGWKNVSLSARQIDRGRDKESLAENDPLEGGDGSEPNVSTFRGTESDLRKSLQFPCSNEKSRGGYFTVQSGSKHRCERKGEDSGV